MHQENTKLLDVNLTLFFFSYNALCCFMILNDSLMFYNTQRHFTLRYLSSLANKSTTRDYHGLQEERRRLEWQVEGGLSAKGQKPPFYVQRPSKLGDL